MTSQSEREAAVKEARKRQRRAIVAARDAAGGYEVENAIADLDRADDEVVATARAAGRAEALRVLVDGLEARLQHEQHKGGEFQRGVRFATRACAIAARALLTDSAEAARVRL